MGVELKVKNVDRAEDIAKRLEKALGGPPYQVQDWYELPHNLFCDRGRTRYRAASGDSAAGALRCRRGASSPSWHATWCSSSRRGACAVGDGVTVGTCSEHVRNTPLLEK